MLTEFVFYWTLANRERLLLLAAGGGQGNISQEAIRDLRIPTPPIDEQARIIRFLRREAGKVEKLEEKVREQLGALAERRGALITAGVTGQVKGLPEMTDSKELAIS